MLPREAANTFIIIYLSLNVNIYIVNNMLNKKVEKSYKKLLTMHKKYGIL